MSEDLADRLVLGDHGDDLHLGLSGGAGKSDPEDAAYELLPPSSVVRGRRLLLDFITIAIGNGWLLSAVKSNFSCKN